MAVITRAYSEVDGQVAFASSINRVIDDLYTLQAGNINDSNIIASAITTSRLNTVAVTYDKVDLEVYLYGQVWT